MILVDTSVWIEFFRAHEPIFEQLREQVEQRNVVGLECIFGELLQGAKSKRERSLIKTYWKNLAKMEEAGLWIEAGQHSSRKKLFSKGIGLIDVFIVTASRKHHAPIWTLDKKLKSILRTDEIFPVLS